MKYLDNKTFQHENITETNVRIKVYYSISNNIISKPSIGMANRG